MDINLLQEHALSPEELIFLQETLNFERAVAWNNYFDRLELGMECEKEYREYQMVKRLRDWAYHLGGRDTLAPSAEYHEQRRDQGHDW